MSIEVELAESGIRTSRLGFGTSRLHQVDQKRRAVLLEKAVDLGITHIDTAPSYGDGLAEEAVGRVLHSHRARLVLATKYGIPPNRLKLRAASPALARSFKTARTLADKVGLRRSRRPRITADGLRRSVEQSLQRMRTDWLDILLLHEPSIETIDSQDEILRNLEQLRSAGLIRSYGLSGGWAGIDSLGGFKELAGCITQTGEDEWPAADPPDITYGAIAAGLRSSSNPRFSSKDAVERLKAALARRRKGVTLFSTLNVEHLQDCAAGANACLESLRHQAA
jgi:aryl-alcohol dehydrogenase-like predicted oxidoreductase